MVNIISWIRKRVPLIVLVGVVIEFNKSHSYQLRNFKCLQSNIIHNTFKSRDLNFKLLQTNSDLPASQDKVLDEIRDKFRGGDFTTAYQILKRHPLVPLTLEDGIQFLNNIELLVPRTDDIQKDERQSSEALSFIYKRLERQNVLKGYGVIEGEYPEKGTDITPAKLEVITGINVTSLTPRSRSNNWTIVALILGFIEYVAADSAGLDPLLTVIPATFLLVFGDQFFLRGALYETVYGIFNPSFKKRVISHEAGHFLVAYLSGLPIRACVTSAWDIIKYPQVNGQAGTVYSDTKLSDELSNSRVTRTSLDRMSVVYMAGIAAEALRYSRAEGGLEDERMLIQFLTSIQPPWNILRIQGQARWAAVQAILLIREHQASYDALVEALEQNKGVGDAIAAIESNLPDVLPSKQRIESKKRQVKSKELDLVMSHVRMMTWRVGGVQPSDDTDPLPQTVDGFIQSASKGITETDGVSTRSAYQQPPDAAVKQFTERIRQLETAVKDGKVGIPSAGDGGVWLNGLTAYKSDVSLNRNSSDPSVSIDLSSVSTEGYEDRIKNIQIKTPSVENDVEAHSPDRMMDDDNAYMLTTHRGYQRKYLENIRRELRRKAISIEDRLRVLDQAVRSKAAIVKK